MFDQDERGPDDELKLRFEAVKGFAPAEKRAAHDLLDALILKHRAKRWTGTGQGSGQKEEPGTKGRAP